jgi:hypothetical protein
MLRKHIGSLIILAMGMVPAAASSFVYDTESAWQASNPVSPGTLDFESSTPGYYSSFTYTPFTFTAGSGWAVIAGGAAPGTGSGNFLSTDSSPTINITLATGVYGVAFNLGANSDSSAIATIIATDANGLEYTTSGFSSSGPAGPAAFWGLRSDAQLVNVRISYVALLPQVDNVRYSNTPLPPDGEPAIPEPGSGTLLFIGGGLILWALSAKSAR